MPLYVYDENNKRYPFADIYPVGSIYMSVNNVNPSTYFGGTWEAWGSGKVPVGVDAEDENFATVELTGGESEHLLTNGEMPQHSHGIGTEIGEKFVTAIMDDEEYIHNGTTDALSGDSRVYPFMSSIYEFNEQTNTNTAGGIMAHNNLQPYITCYMWKRTA